MKDTDNKSNDSMALNIIIGVVAVAVIFWLATRCTTCH